MATRITPRLVELTYEATLSSFWRRKALYKFLLGSHVKENFILSWSNDETKREFLDRLFPKLQSTDKGKTLIFQIAKNLAEQSTFPDLRNWEDSDQKIQNAKKSINELKAYLTKEEDDFRRKREKELSQENVRTEQEKIRRSHIDRIKLQQQLDSMSGKIGTQEGGYEFEDWFHRLLDYCEIVHRKPYKSDGRGIDGSLTYEGTTYLVELKFTTKQCDPSKIDSLKAKVNKKADNTMGIMISIAGYSDTAISEASGSKTTLIIWDSSHLYLFLTGAMDFGEIISRTRRHASQTGEAYLPVSKFEL